MTTTQKETIQFSLVIASAVDAGLQSPKILRLLLRLSLIP